MCEVNFYESLSLGSFSNIYEDPMLFDKIYKNLVFLNSEISNTDGNFESFGKT